MLCKSHGTPFSVPFSFGDVFRKPPPPLAVWLSFSHCELLSPYKKSPAQDKETKTWTGP